MNNILLKYLLCISIYIVIFLCGQTFANETDMDSFLRIPNIVGFNGSVYSLGIQDNGKIIVGGAFTGYNGGAVNMIIRLNSDGTKDSSFDIGSGFNAHVRAIAIQPDKKIIVGGAFTGYNGSTNNYIVRLNSDGTKDSSFDIGSGFNAQVRAIAIQPDGKIIVGGAITTYSGSTIYRIVRLNTNGTKDNSFIIGNGFNNNIRAIAIQSDGKIILGGGFIVCSGIVTNRIVRLNTDGTRDFSFNIGSGFNDQVNSLHITTDGKIVIGGLFTTYNGIAANRIIRLNTDGTRDFSFNIGSGFNDQIRSVDIQNDGKVIAGGAFTTYNGVAANRIIRLNTDGNIDTSSFDIGDGFNTTVNSLTIQNDGKIIIGGDFTSYNGVSLGGYLVRLHGNSYISLLDTNNENIINTEFTSKGYTLSGDILSGSAPMVFIDTEGRVPVELRLKNKNILLTLPQNLEIKNSSNMVDYTGTFTPPTFIANSKSDTIVTIQVGSSSTGLSLTNGLATLSVPVDDATAGDLVEIFYSEDNGDNWSIHTKTFVEDINGQAYVSFTTNHFTDFAISTPLSTMTGSFTINNDDVSTISQNITLNISITPAVDQMRFSNDGISWSTREPYATSKSWTLSGINGLKTVYAEFDLDNDTIADLSTNDTIDYVAGNIPHGSTTGNVRLEITTTSGTCVYGTSLYIGSHTAQFTAYDMTGNNFLSSFYCSDTEGIGIWTMTMQAVSPLSDGNPSHDIPADNVSMIASPNYVDIGSCSTGQNTTSWVSIGAVPGTILHKNDTDGSICTIKSDTVNLAVHIPDNQAVGIYTGSLTLNMPF